MGRRRRRRRGSAATLNALARDAERWRAKRDAALEDRRAWANDWSGAADAPSHVQAERQAAEYLRWLGFTDATVSRTGADGGVDVLGAEVVAQVKFKTAATPVRDIRDLFGTRQAQDRLPVFFSRGYTRGAQDEASGRGMPLFVFTDDLRVKPLNASAFGLRDRATARHEAAARAARDAAAAVERERRAAARRAYQAAAEKRAAKEDRRAAKVRARQVRRRERSGRLDRWATDSTARANAITAARREGIAKSRARSRAVGATPGVKRRERWLRWRLRFGLRPDQP